MLENYQKKRDFSKTPEPKGAEKKDSESPKLKFVVQKHFASHLHYDFRLEIGDVLKSWAVPKGPSLNPQNKRLAIQTEDHPLEYGDFKGEIPKGEYGAGRVEIWDQGEFIPKINALEQWEKGKIEFQLIGQKLKGSWVLLRFKNEPKNWLIIKMNDEYADLGTEIADAKP